MAIFLISDTHFGHKNIIKYCTRPFRDKYEMDRVMIDNWNRTVSHDDTVIHLGDFAFLSQDLTREVIESLNGNKILVMGNHDTRGEAFYLRAGFKEVYDLAPGMVIKYTTFCMSHYPYRDTMQKERGHLINRAPVRMGTPLVHGHVHTLWSVRENMVNLSVDVRNFYPVPLEQVQELVEESRRRIDKCPALTGQAQELLGEYDD